MGRNTISISTTNWRSTVNFLAPCKGIRPDLGMREIFACGLRNPAIFFAVEAGTLGFGIRDTAQETQNPLKIGIQNPNSTD